MQSFMDTRHEVYIFYCHRLPLNESGFWEKLINILKPLTQLTQFKPDVKVAIYDRQIKDFIETDGMDWSIAGIRKIIPTGDERQIEKLTLFYPALRQCYENKITPDIFFKISIKPTDKEKRYDQSLMLTLKKDFLLKFSRETLEIIISDLEKLTDPVFKIKTERTWAIPVSEFQYTDEMQFFLPSLLLDSGDELVLKDEYSDWNRF